MLLLQFHAHTNGDLRRLSHGFDYQGRLCGVDESVSGLPYLYYCSENSLFPPQASRHQLPGLRPLLPYRFRRPNQLLLRLRFQ